MRLKGILLFCVCVYIALEACSQGNFSTSTYPFPIPVEAPPTVTMQKLAEEQIDSLKRMKMDPFHGGKKLVVDLSEISDSAWCYPLPGAKVISPYGGRGRRGHSGVDIKTKANDKIYAVFDGLVTMSQPFAGYGNCIVLRHANGMETLYSHNSKNLVRVGELVKAGQVIALTGRTGRATTEHLHFELRVGGKHYNPQLIFDHQTKQLKRHVITFTKGGGAKVE